MPASTSAPACTTNNDVRALTLFVEYSRNVMERVPVVLSINPQNPGITDAESLLDSSRACRVPSYFSSISSLYWFVSSRLFRFEFAVSINSSPACAIAGAALRFGQSMTLR